MKKTALTSVVMFFLFVSTAMSGQMKIPGLDLPVLSIEAFGNSCLLIGAGNANLRKTTNAGETFTVKDSKLPANIPVRRISMFNEQVGYLFGGSYISKTTDGGESWNLIPRFTDEGLRAIVILSVNEVVVTATNTTIYRSTNGGQNWIQTQLFIAGDLNSATASGDVILAGSSNAQIIISTNRGVSWSVTNQPWTPMSSTFSGNKFYFAAYDNVQTMVMSSTNNGIAFVQEQLLPKTWVSEIRFNGSVGYIAGIVLGGPRDTACLYKKSGASWQRVFIGSQWESFNCLAFLGNKAFIGADSGYVYVDEVVGIHPTGTIVPSQYSLSQNYPNPFNPLTTIKFQIVKSEFVKLQIYSSNGIEVESLINLKLEPGSYGYDFYGDNLPSGVYYYRLSAGNFTNTKKMVLLK